MLPNEAVDALVKDTLAANNEEELSLVNSKIETLGRIVEACPPLVPRVSEQGVQFVRNDHTPFTTQ